MATGGGFANQQLWLARERSKSEPKATANNTEVKQQGSASAPGPERKPAKVPAKQVSKASVFEPLEVESQPPKANIPVFVPGTPRM